MRVKSLLLKLCLMLCFSTQTPIKAQTPVEYLKANGIVGAQKYLEILAGALIGTENAPYFSEQLQIIPDKLKFFMIKQTLKNDLTKRTNLKNLLATNFSDASLKEISRAKGFNLVMTNNLVKSLKELNDLINGNLREYILDLSEPKNVAEYQALLTKIKNEFQARPANDAAKFDLITKIIEIADVEFIGTDDPKFKEEHPAESVVKIGDQVIPNYFFKAREKFSIALGGMGYEYGTEKKYIGPEIFETMEAIKATIKSLTKAPVVTADTRTPEEIALEALGTEINFETFISSARTLFSVIQKKVSQGDSQDNLNKFLNKLTYISLARKESLSENERMIYNKIETDHLALIKTIKDLKLAGLAPLTNPEVQQLITLRDFIIEKLNALIDLEILEVTAESDLAKVIHYLESIKIEEPKIAPTQTLTEAQLLEKAIDSIITPAKNADGSAISISTYLNNDYDDSGVPNLTIIQAFYDNLAQTTLIQKDAPISDMKINRALAANMAKRSALKKSLDDAFPKPPGRGIPALKHQYQAPEDKDAIQLADLNTKFTAIRKILGGTLPEIAQILNSNKNKIKPDPEILETQINTILSIDVDPTNKAEEGSRNLIKSAIDDATTYGYAKSTTKLEDARNKLFPPSSGIPPTPEPVKPAEPTTQTPQKSALEIAVGEIIAPDKNADGSPMTIKSYLNSGYSETKIPNLQKIKEFYDKLSITVLSKYDAAINAMTINEILTKDSVQRENLRKAIEEAFSGRGIPALKHQFAQSDENAATLIELNAKFEAIRKIISGTLAEISQILTANKNSDSPNPTVLEEQINKIIKAEKISDLQLDPANPIEETYKNEIKTAIDDAKIYNYANPTTNLAGALDKLFPPAPVVVLPPVTPPPAPEVPVTPPPVVPIVEAKPAAEGEKTLEELAIIAAESTENFEKLNKASKAKTADKKASAADKATAKQEAKDGYDLKNSTFKTLVAKVKASGKEDVKALRNQFILEKKIKEKNILIEAFNSK